MAAAYLAGGSGFDSEYDSDLAFWGIPEQDRPGKPPDFEVYPENWETVCLFVRLQTQWIISPMGQRTGLIYQAIPVVARLMGVKMTRELFSDLQLMEITTINETAKNVRK